MATVSNRFRYTLAVTMLASVCVTGCNTVMPVKLQATGKNTGTEPVSEQVMPVISPVDVPLPRQAYSPAGEKTPYVPQPNPYTTGDVSVPEEARSMFVVATYRLKKGDPEGASRKYRELTEKYPSLSGPWLKLGNIAEQNEKYADAAELYKKATSANRNNVNAYIALGLVERRQGNFFDSQRAYLDALGVWKDFPEAHLNLAILYDLYLNRAEEAQKHYEAFYFLTGEKDQKAHKWLAEIRHRTGIEGSFIDIPPVRAAGSPGTGTKDPVAAVNAGGSK